MPFKSIDGLVESIVRLLLTWPSALRDATRPDDAGPLSAVFPRFHDVWALALNKEPTLDVRDRAATAFAALLASLCTQHPLLLIVDDVQWGDVDSITFIRAALALPMKATWLFIRRDEAGAPASEFEEAISHAASSILRLTLQPLDAEDTRALARAAVINGDDAKIDALVRESQGWPIFITPLAAFDGPATVQTLVERALPLLSAPSRRLLELVAIAGLPIERSVAAELIGPRLVEAISELRSARLLRSDAIERLEPYHGRIGEAVQGTMPEALSQPAHLDLARAMSAHPKSPQAAIARHFRRGGDDRQAALHVERAGHQALETLAFSAAARHFEDAITWSGDAAVRVDLEPHLARALAGAGRSRDAGTLYLSLAARTTGSDAFAVRRAGVEQLLLGGALEPGLSEFASLAREVGLAFPRGQAGAGVRTLGVLLRTWLFGKLPRRKGVAIDARAELAGMGFRGLLPVAPAQAGYFAAVELEAAQRSGDLRWFSRSLAQVGSGLFGPLPGWLGRLGERLVEYATTLARAANESDPRLDGALELSRAACAFWNGAWSETLERISLSTQHFHSRQLGWLHEHDLAQVMRLRALEELGRWKEVRDGVAAMRADATERGDLYALVTAELNAATAALASDDPASCRRLAQQAVAHWPLQGPETLQSVYALRASVMSALYERRDDDAWSTLDLAWPSLGLHRTMRPGKIDLFVLRGRTALATGRTRVAIDAARALETVGRADGRAHGHQLRAGAAFIDGDLDGAKGQLTAAADQYRALQMHAAEAAARLRLAMLSGASGDEERARLESLGCVSPDSMALIYAPGFALRNAR